jgi:hypothetical protein
MARFASCRAWDPPTTGSALRTITHIYRGSHLASMCDGQGLGREILRRSRSYHITFLVDLGGIIVDIF